MARQYGSDETGRDFQHNDSFVSSQQATHNNGATASIARILDSSAIASSMSTAANSGLAGDSSQSGSPKRTPRRSHPIAIRRVNSRDSDCDSGVLVADLEALDLENSSSGNAAVHSLPSRLFLRAPLLGSLQSEGIHHRTIPPMQLSEQAAQITDAAAAYGSLRDSQHNVFLGPASYAVHDRRLSRSDRNVRFAMHETLSIADRILQSRRAQKLKQGNEPTSTLAAMLEASPASSALSSGMNDEEPSALNDPVAIGQVEQEKKPTSLTGLEVLRGGLDCRLEEASGPHGLSVARSYSDSSNPSSDGRSLLRNNDVSSSYRNPVQANSFLLPSPRTTRQESVPVATATVPGILPSMKPQTSNILASPESPSMEGVQVVDDDDPMTEEAFNMDME